MQLKRIVPGLLLLTIIGAMFGLKVWQRQVESDPTAPTQVKGPAVILFRGDNSPSCQTIHQLVDEAATRNNKQVNFVQLDWSDESPLIKKYQVRFLPTVVFVNQQNKEVGRIVGESPAVQQKLKKALTDIDKLVLR